jgi:hypothetical protein
MTVRVRPTDLSDEPFRPLNGVHALDFLAGLIVAARQRCSAPHKQLQVARAQSARCIYARIYEFAMDTVQ